MPRGLRFFRRRQFLACLTLAATFAIAGCNSNPNERKPSTDQAQISGSILNNGKPVTVDSQVTFESSEKSAVAIGKVDALGKFSLTAVDSTIGIPAGRYSVTVRAPEKPSEPVGSEAYKAKMMQGGNMAAPPKSTDIPESVQSMTSTPLKLEVKAGANTFDIDLAKLPS